MNTLLLDALTNILTEAGFVKDGTTRKYTIGAHRAIGGRGRFAKPGTDLRVTVGPVTTNVYRLLESGRPAFLCRFRTKGLDLADFRSFLEANPT